MNVLIIGVTGLLGSEAAHQLIEKGHKIRGLALPPLPSGVSFSPELELVFGDYLTCDEQFLNDLFKGMDAFIFAAGIDERIDTPAPAFETFNKYNVDPLARMFKIAKKHGLKHSVILGSYFTHFVKNRPELELTKHHPYIRSRELQKQMALSEAAAHFSVAVLELPYIFGTQTGRKPVWVFLIDMVRKMKGITFFPKGGTAIITVKQAGQAIVGALEKTIGAQAYPLGYYNLTWRELLTIFHKYLGKPKKPIITIPNFMFKITTKRIKRKKEKLGFEGGLDLPLFTKLQCSKQYIKADLGAIQLGVMADDLDKAIGSSVAQSVAVLDNNINYVAMKI